MKHERLRATKIATGIASLPSNEAEHVAAVDFTPMRSVCLRDARGGWVRFTRAPVGRTALLIASVDQVGDVPAAHTGFTAVRAVRRGELIALGHGELFTSLGPGGERTALGVSVAGSVDFDWLDRNGVLRLLGSTVTIRAVDVPDPLPITGRRTGS